jgi:cytochrome c biogenesis protein CcmG, thiol:disulfide interchange protein DsbE
MSAPADEPRRRGSGVRTIALALAVVVVILVGVAYAATRSTGDDPGAAASGEGAVLLEDRPPATRAFALPPATLEGFADGDPVDLTSFRGTPLVVNFWASWCVPCVNEMPDFQEAAAELEGEVTFLGVDVQDAPPNAEAFVKRLGVDYPLALDPQREFHREVGNFAMPTTLFVDTEGIVRYRHTGPLSRDELVKLLADYLDVTPAA